MNNPPAYLSPARREPAWRKSSRSASAGAQCVEVRAERLDAAVVAVRDSKHPSSGTLTVSAEDWAGLALALRR